MSFLFVTIDPIRLSGESGESEDSETRIPTRVEDAYVDEDAQVSETTKA